MKRSHILIDLVLDEKDVKVAEKLVAVAGIIGRFLAGRQAFEEISLKLIQEMIPVEAERVSAIKVCMFIFNDLRMRPDAYLTYRNYAEMKGTTMSPSEIRSLGIEISLFQEACSLKNTSTTCIGVRARLVISKARE